MKLLLDTHIWIWSVLVPRNLHQRVTKALADEANQLWLSPVSIWEFLTLVRKNRIQSPDDPLEWINTTLQDVPMREAPVTYEVAMESAHVNLPHYDPADRFLAATARVFGLTLVTGDRRLIKAPGLSVLSNR